MKKGIILSFAIALFAIGFAHAQDNAAAIFEKVDQQPAFNGGQKAMFTHIMQTMKYPAQAKRLGVEGKVYVQFVVETDGTISQVKALKGIGAGCDAEAKRVVETMANQWQPGVKDGQTVRTRMVLPFTFALDDKEEEEGR